MLAAAKFNDPHLVALAMTLQGRDHFGRAHVGSANGHRRSGTYQQNLIKFDTGALVCVELLDTHHGTFLDAVLFTARGYHGIHCCNSEDGLWGRKKEPRIISGGGRRVKPAWILAEEPEMASLARHIIISRCSSLPPVPHQPMACRGGRRASQTDLRYHGAFF